MLSCHSCMGATALNFVDHTDEHSELSFERFILRAVGDEVVGH